MSADGEGDDEEFTLDQELAIFAFVDSLENVTKQVYGLIRQLERVAAEARRIEHRMLLRHPDVAYLDAQLDGYYREE